MAKKRILAVDDEESITNLIKLNLEEAGEYEVRTETKGENAIAAIREFKPDLILLDVIMPGVDGSDIAGQIKSDENLKNIPIVFLTAAVKEEEVASKNGIIGGHPFIAKPVTTEKLINSIEKHIKK